MKVVVKLMVERFCLAWCSSSLRTCRGTLPIGAPEGLGEIQICIEVLKFVFKTRLSHIVVFGC